MGVSILLNRWVGLRGWYEHPEVSWGYVAVRLTISGDRRGVFHNPTRTDWWFGGYLMKHTLIVRDSSVER